MSGISRTKIAAATGVTAILIAIAVVGLIASSRASRRDHIRQALLEAQLHEATVEFARLETELATQRNRLQGRPSNVHIDLPWPRNDAPSLLDRSPVPIDPSRRDRMRPWRKSRVEPFRTEFPNAY